MLEAMKQREACPMLNNPGVQENFFKASFHKVQAAYGEYRQMQKRLQDTEHQLQNVLAWAHARSDTEATEQAEVAIHELKNETDALKNEVDEQNNHNIKQTGMDKEELIKKKEQWLKPVKASKIPSNYKFN